MSELDVYELRVLLGYIYEWMFIRNDVLGGCFGRSRRQTKDHFLVRFSIFVEFVALLCDKKNIKVRELDPKGFVL